MAEKTKKPRSLLITGASSGLGEALALAYAKPGIFLALSGRDSQRLLAVEKTCCSQGAHVTAQIVDVADRAAMLRWIDSIDSDHPLDLVIANAGISAGSGGNGESEEQVRNIFAVNLAGVLNTVLPVLPHMRRRKYGRIAIISSMAGLRGMPNAPAYSASKVAVKAYGEALRGWLKPEGILVSVICPGFFESRLTAQNKFPMPFLMKAPKAAEKIISGLSRGKPLIAFPLPMYWATRLVCALPAGLGDLLLGRMPKKD